MLRENVLDSKKLGRATHAACNLWFRLLVKVDDFGNFPDDAVLIRTTCFQWRRKMRTSHVQQWITELVGIGLISRYEVDGELYLHFERFEDFQQMRYEKVARFPRLEMPIAAPGNLPERLCDAHIAATGDAQSPTAAMCKPHRPATPVASTKEGVKLSKRSEAEGAAWKFLGVDGSRFNAAIRELCANLYEAKNGETPAEFIGACMDGTQALGLNIPPALAQRAAELRAQPASARILNFLPEKPKQTRDWKMEDLCPAR